MSTTNTTTTTTTTTTTPATTTPSTSTTGAFPSFDFKNFSVNSSTKSDTKTETKPMSFNFSTSSSGTSNSTKFEFTGLKFNSSQKDSSKSGSSSGSSSGFKSMSFSGGGNSDYDKFLNSTISSGKNTLIKDEKSSSDSKPIKLSRKKENLFEVNYVPISGVHFAQIFVYKENEFMKDKSLGPSFNQPIHVSQTFE